MCELVQQVSTAECVVGSTFGCVANAALSGPQVWVTGGCRGTFRVSGSTVIGCSQRQHNRFLFNPRGIHRCAGHPATDKQSVGSKVAEWAAQMLSKLSLAPLPDNRMMRSVFNYSEKDTTRNRHRGQGGVGSIGNMSDSSGTYNQRCSQDECSLPAAPTLGVFTYLANDHMGQCEGWMRHYLHHQRIPTARCARLTPYG